MIARRLAFVCLVAPVALSSCARASANQRAPLTDADLLHAAVHALNTVIVFDIFSPPQASRAYAYASVAAYEALRPAHPGYPSLAGQLNELTPPPRPEPSLRYSFPVASVHAFMTVGRELTFSRDRIDSLRAQLDATARRQAGKLSDEEYERSIAYGDSIAAHVLAWAKRDHYLETRGMAKYTVTTDPGQWTPTPPAYMDGVEPNWGKLRPFALHAASEVRVAPPIRFDTSSASPYYKEVMEVYRVGKAPSADELAIASFWDCNPYVMHVQGHAMFATKKITPGGHWMGIVGIASRKAHLDMMQSAAAYARTAVALADGFIAAWDEKYRSAMIRPETVINRYVDEEWQPILQTPPFPEYPSAHSVISNAAAVVLSEQFGSSFAFVDSTEMEYGLPPRSFTSFAQAAEEAAISRLYGGIHYRRAVEQGSVAGRGIGEVIASRVVTLPAAAAKTIAAAPGGGPSASGARSDH